MTRRRTYPNDLLTAVMHVRVTEDQQQAVKQRATDADMGPSEWIRGLIEAKLRENEQA